MLVPDAMGLPRWLSGKESTCHCRRPKNCEFDPWVRKIPLEEEMATRSSILAWRIKDRGAWWATVHGVAKSWTQLSDYTHMQPDGRAQILSICLEGHVLPTVESKWNLELSRNEDPFEHASSTERGSLSLVWLGRWKGMAPGNS